ncbi:unnamed protein product [Orchesella dallaii]|uniref:Uncharacterized protein n=1 Tax=Orchesella dallaii TaxID=48710 RepID=A0ABP1S985_9HEXA
MQHRSSSLVTISLDDEATDEEVGSSRGPAAVIEIWQNDETCMEIDGFRSAEKIFTFVVDINHHESQMEQEKLHAVGICNKIFYCFGKFKNGNLCSRGWKQLSEYIGKIWEAFMEKLSQRCERSYLETYFMYANFCGVSPFRIGNENQRVVWLKKVPFYIINTLASYDTILMAKELMLNMIGAHEIRSTDVRLYLFNSKVGANLLVRVGFLMCFQCRAHKYNKAVKIIAASTFSKHLYTVKIFTESLLVCGTSLIVVLIQTHIGLFDGMENYIIENANYASSLFCFTRLCQPTFTNESVFNSGAILLGLLGWSIKLAGNLLEQIARDGILLSALTLGKSADAFQFKKKVKDSTSVDAALVGTHIQTEYEELKNISKCINSAFNVVFRFFLLANVFMFAVFVDEWFNPHIGKLAKSIKLANVVFACITFYYANKTAKIGDRFREWMRNKNSRTILGMSEMEVVMENSSSSSVGFGRGALYIYDSTLIGVATGNVDIYSYYVPFS